MNTPRFLRHVVMRVLLMLALTLPWLVSSASGQAVATPAFLPAAGSSLAKFPVVISCSTSGAVIHYTVTGVEPTIYDPTVVSGGAVQIARNMTLKAKAFNGANSSATASTTFDLTGEVSAGSQFILGLVTNGQVYSWGNQSSGRMSTGSTANTNVLAPALSKFNATTTITNASSISSGANHGLLLDMSGNVWGFGANSFGEAGNSSTSATVPYAQKVVKSATLTDYLTGCTEVAAGLEFSSALESGGFVRTWGNQLSGRLGNGLTTAGSRKFAGRVKTNSTTDLSGIVSIASGKDFALAREDSAFVTPGTLGKVWMWGNNASGNLGTGNTTAQSYATKVKLNATTDLGDAWDADAGDDFAAIVRWKTGDSTLQGSVWTFGNRVNGRLGDNGAITGTSSFPVQVQKLVGSTYSQLTGIVQISTGASHTLALDNAGNVWAWGGNATGALGDNTTVDKKYAVKVRNPGNTGDLANIARISAGGINGSAGFSTAVATDGTVYVWGSNANGLLANGTTSTTVFAKLPVVVTQLKTIPGFPTVSLSASVTTPNDPGAATLTATVADPQGNGTIQKTEFYVQGVLHATRTSAPWTDSISGLAQGTYSCYAKTTDVDGNETTSLSASFTIAVTLDSDHDGLLDSWEMQKFGNLSQTASGDPDGDKVSNLDEYSLGTNPNSAVDANADGIPDDWVTWQLSLPGGVAASSLPPGADPDQDELTNLMEFQNGTNPRKVDTDGDGQSDWQELAQGTNPGDINSLAPPLIVPAYQGTTNLHVSQSLPNPTPGVSVQLALSGNVPTTTGFEMKSSNVAGGPAYEWIDISATGEHLLDFKTDSTAMVQRSIGFSFPFYGASYANVFISGQGFLTLTDPGGWSPGEPMEFQAALPNVDGHRPLISPYQQYLEPDVQGDIYYKTYTDHVVIQWEQVKIYGFDSRPTFQAVIYSDGSIRFNYKSIPLTSGGAQVVGYLSGVQNADGTDGIGASWYTTTQQGLPIHSLAPLTVRFAAPSSTAGPWVTTTSSTASGNPLTWELNFQGTGLTTGDHDALLQFRKNVSSPVLYSRTIRLAIAPPGTTGNDTMQGTTGDDVLSGVDGNDTINGDAGNDTINGGPGNDTIRGGPGNDVIDGETGKDAYYYDLGDGNDIITDYQGIFQSDDSLADYSDLYFGAGITPGMIRSSYLPNYNGIESAIKLEIRGASPGSIILPKWNLKSSANVYTSSRWRFHFADGTVWNGKLFWVDSMFTYPFEGFTGGTGNDTVTGTDAAESLRGLEGNDTLQGGRGSDSYFYRWGDGNDVIQDTPAGNELSSLTIYGAALDDKLTYDFVPPSHLRINVSHPSDLSKNGSITINDWYLTQPSRSRDGWRFYVQNSAGALVDISQKLRFLGTNGPDNLNLNLLFASTGQTLDAGGGDDVVVGTNWDDTILGNLGNDTLSGGYGNDTLDGGDGSDILYGEGGNDVLLGGLGADVLQGGDGDDRLVGGPGNDDLQGGVGSDTYEWNLGDGNDIITDSTSDIDPATQNRLNFGPGIAPSQVDVIPGPGAALTFQIRDSSNQLNGSVVINDWYKRTLFTANHAANWRIGFSGSTTVWDGRTLVTSGPDLISGTAAGDTIQGGDGDDILLGLDGDDTLNGGPGNDSLNGGPGADILAGSSGDDDLQGDVGNDIYQWNLGDGNDVITDSLTDAADTTENRLVFGPGIVPSQVHLEPGSDRSLKFSVWNSSSQQIGSVKVNNWYANVRDGLNHASNWRIAFTGNPTVWDGRTLVTPGPDSLLGTPATDVMLGGSGDDSLRGLAGDDSLSGQDGDDFLDGGDGNDTLYGGAGNDSLDGGAGNDAFYGGPGDDYIFGDTGSDTYYWQVGDGNDTLEEYFQNPGDINVLSFSGEVSPGVTITRQMVRMSVLGLNNAVFKVFAPDGSALATITLRNWQLTRDNWKLQFPADTVPFDWRLLVRVGTSGTDTIDGSGYNDEIQGLEGDDILNGWDGDDAIDGGAGNDTLSGGNGNDTLIGGDGNDILHGDYGNDRLEGGAGNDTLFGDDGNDVLIGGAGDDILQGGDGVDHYVWAPGDGADTIIDSSGGIVVFSQEVQPSSVRLVPAGQNLRLEVMSAGSVVGSVTITDWYLGSPDNWAIEFASGEVWHKRTLGTSGNDYLIGSSDSDRINGGAGDDSFYGGEGDEIFTGGPGNDTIAGNQGRNEYVYQLGDGNDIYTISARPTGVAKDVVNLHSILRSACSIQVLDLNQDVNLLITFLSNGETITIHGGSHALIEFADATVEFDATGHDLRIDDVNTGTPGWRSSPLAWHDDDGDGFPNDVEDALHTFNATSANSQNAAVSPVVDAIADASITVATGNRYPTLSAALAAADAGRGGKPYVIVKVEPGIYAEDLQINLQGVFIQGPGSAGRATIIRKNRYQASSISGRRLIFNGLCFGKTDNTLGLTLTATDVSEGIRFTNCLLQDNVVTVALFGPRQVRVTAGAVAFVHCTFNRLAGLDIAQLATATFLNSLVDTIPGSSWSGDGRLRQYSSLPSPLGSYQTPPDLGVRLDGLLKVNYPSRTSVALDHVSPSDRLTGWRDLDGELRDSSPDLGCDEYIDTDNAGAGDQLQDSWERQWFGNLTSQSAAGDPDGDGKTNLVEYNAGTNPLSPGGSPEQTSSVDFSSSAVYSSANLLGTNPIPSVNSANWLLTSDGKVTFAGRQGALEYQIVVAQPTIAALFLDATFKSLTDGTEISGGARIYLDGQLLKDITGSLNNLVVPFYLLSTGTHTVRIELANSQRNYRPVINSVAIRALDAQYDPSTAAANLTGSLNRMIVLPTESLASPAFVEGESVTRQSVSLRLPAQDLSLAVQEGPDLRWYANVPLEASPEDTGLALSFGSEQEAGVQHIRWKPAILEDIPVLTIRKGDALRLQASANASPAGSSVTYWNGSQMIGTAVKGTAVPYDFDTTGTFVITAKVGGVPVPGAQMTLTVLEASFSPALAAARSVSSTIALPSVPNSLLVEGAASLNLNRGGSIIYVNPKAVGPKRIVARIGAGGPIVAAGSINVFNVTGTGSNGGGKVISHLPGNRDLISMSYSVEGPIPPNLRIRVEVWIPGTTFLDGSTVAWLTAGDFDEFGVANHQVIYNYSGSPYGQGHGLCQKVDLYLAE